MSSLKQYQSQNLSKSQLGYNQNSFKKQKRNLSPKSLNNLAKNQSSSKEDQISPRSHKVLSNQDKIIQQPNQSQSQQQEIKKQTQLLQRQIQKEQQKRKANNKVVVGTGFSFDITQFFKFQKKKKLDSKQGDLFAQMSGSVLAWLILLYSVINSSVIPGWIMNIKATKLLRIAWRFLLQSIIVIPFVLYQYRVGSEQVKNQYKWRHILKPTHLKKVYLSAISTSIWFTCILTVFEWTFISHGLVLGALSNFFLSIHRKITKSNHEVEGGGQLLVILGIILVIYDSITLVPQQVQPYKYDVINPFYLSRHWYQRVIADLIALCVSFAQSKIARYTADMKSHYPPNLSILLVNIFIFINMIFSTYFLNGLTFDYDLRFGLFSIFSQQHFASFLYMSILLNTGLFISYVMISKLFPDPIFPALAMTLDPMLATLLVQIFGVQYMPRPISFIGYLLILPGVIIILIGQCLYQRKAQQESKQNQKTQQLMKQLQALKKASKLYDKKNKLKKIIQLRNSIADQQKIYKNQKTDKDSSDSRSNLTKSDNITQPLIDGKNNRKQSLQLSQMKK